MKYGCRAHDFGQNTATELASRLAANNIQCIQLAPKKAILFDGTLSDAAPVIGDALRKHDISTAVVGCYINPLHPDPAVRQANHDLFFEHVACAHALNGNMVGLETGTPTPDYSPTPLAHTEEAFQNLLHALSLLVEKAESLSDTYIGLEAVHCHTISTGTKMKRLIDTLGSNRVRVIYDPANLLDDAQPVNQERLFKEYIDLLHERISVIHVKPYHASLDIKAAFDWIKQSANPLDILLEGVPEADIEHQLHALKEMTR